MKGNTLHNIHKPELCIRQDCKGEEYAGEGCDVLQVRKSGLPLSSVEEESESTRNRQAAQLEAAAAGEMRSVTWGL